MPSVYEIVTDKIIEKLERGTVPWRKPWGSAGKAVSGATGKEYRGINTILLDPGEYVTYSQAEKMGGKVKKGEKASIAIFWKELPPRTITDKKTGEELTDGKFTAMLRYYSVFEIGQCDGLERKYMKTEEHHHDPITEAEKIVTDFIRNKGPRLKQRIGRAVYYPAYDTIEVPPITDYKIREEYYSTLFHEMVHSTGHVTRLKRITGAAAFGSKDYSKEELVAEIGAAFLCGDCGIVDTTLDNSASYCQSWLRKLKEDSKMIVFAASAAQKAVDFIHAGDNNKGGDTNGNLFVSAS